jgi:hypothetical protein
MTLLLGLLRRRRNGSIWPSIVIGPPKTTLPLDVRALL